MSAKQFFKSNVFKCLVTLLCVLLVCGIFLTVMNSLLYVSAEERFDRALAKIYGKSVSTETVAVENYNSNATIEEAYKVKEDGNYLVKSTGKGGFAGTVTCWVVVEVSNGKISGVQKVIVDSYVGETQMAEIKDSFLEKFSSGYTDGIIYSTADGFLVTGSTRSSNAICNAVNGALDFVNAKFGNVKTQGEILLAEFESFYGDVPVSVYGLDEDGNDKLITVEDETVKAFPANVTMGSATVIEYYKVRFNDGEKDVLQYAVTSKGTGGYENGTVTSRVAVNIEDGKPSSIYKVAVIDNEKQSWLDKVKHYDKYVGVDITGEGFAFSKDDGYLTTGATGVSNAINNSINGAVNYLKTLSIDDPVTDGGAEGGTENE